VVDWPDSGGGRHGGGSPQDRVTWWEPGRRGRWCEPFTAGGGRVRVSDPEQRDCSQAWNILE
jgi:hypothetical protein